MSVTDTATDTFTADWQRWHEKHEAFRADRHGFLAITGLHWLSPEPQRFPDAPGAWSTGPSGLPVMLASSLRGTVNWHRETAWGQRARLTGTQLVDLDVVTPLRGIQSC